LVYYFAFLSSSQFSCWCSSWLWPCSSAADCADSHIIMTAHLLLSLLKKPVPPISYLVKFYTSFKSVTNDIFFRNLFCHGQLPTPELITHSLLFISICIHYYAIM
jgi:hypothetical protein